MTRYVFATLGSYRIRSDGEIYEGLQSCERLRLALESFKPEKDQEGFVRDYGTGNAMPDFPQFVNYSSAEGAPFTFSASKVTSRPAQFTRVTQRFSRVAAAPQPQPDDEMYNYSPSSSRVAAVRRLLCRLFL
jgi:hypothetical protein